MIEPRSIREALAEGDPDSRHLYDVLMDEVPRQAKGDTYRRWKDLVISMPRMLYNRTDIGGSPDWDPVGSLLWLPSNNLQIWSSMPRENPFQYTGWIVGMHDDSDNLIDAVLSVMYARHGIQPWVVGLTDESSSHLAMERIRQTYRDISSSQLRKDVEQAADVASTKLEESGAENIFIEQATRFLVLLRSYQVTADMMDDTLHQHVGAENEMGLVLESAPYLLSWLWWSARVAVNDPGQIDWGAHPWPWELD